MQFDDYRDKRRNLKPIYAPARMSDRNIESNAVNSDICPCSIETNSLDVCHVSVFIEKYCMCMPLIVFTGKSLDFDLTTILLV